MHAPFAHRAGALRLARGVTTLAAVAAFVAALNPLNAQDRSTALARAESAYLELRDLKDQIDVTAGRGVATSAHGLPLRELGRRYARARLRFANAMTQVGQQPSLSTEDHRAFDVMTSTYGRELVPSPLAAPRRDTSRIFCAGSTSPAHEAREALAQRLYKCFGAAARHVTVGDTVLDRLSILGLLSREPDADRRRTLLLALEPMWRTVVGNGGADNPYRRLIRLSAEQPDSERPDDLAARKLGIERAQLESWLVSILERWRDVTPAALVEPWDFYYNSGAASRALNARAPRDALTRIAGAFYAGLGADPRALRIHYDLVPRSAKGAVSYTTFGARPQRAEGRWLPGEPWIITSYRDGGFGNLVELLHEVGHGVHIAAIRTRPAFADWPDSDTFTEGIGDLAALEAFEPTWQWKYLGDSASTVASLGEKYSSIVLDVAWGLFELRMLRAPDTDPNQLWTQLTSQYLHIAPHADLPWWAMRGQLVDAPGYMVNYALGAILVADLREHIAEQGGRFTTGDRNWYRRVSEALYQFGLERPTQTVLTEFLGRPLSPDAILRDMARLAGAGTGAPAP